MPSLQDKHILLMLVLGPITLMERVHHCQYHCPWYINIDRGKRGQDTKYNFEFLN